MSVDAVEMAHSTEGDLFVSGTIYGDSIVTEHNEAYTNIVAPAMTVYGGGLHVYGNAVLDSAMYIEPIQLAEADSEFDAEPPAGNWTYTGSATWVTNHTTWPTLATEADPMVAFTNIIGGTWTTGTVSYGIADLADYVNSNDVVDVTFDYSSATTYNTNSYWYVTMALGGTTQEFVYAQTSGAPYYERGTNSITIVDETDTNLVVTVVNKHTGSEASLQWFHIDAIQIEPTYENERSLTVDRLLPSAGTNLYVGGNVLPIASNTYSLGSADYPFESLYVGPGTIYIGGVAINPPTADGTMPTNLIIDVSEHSLTWENNITVGSHLADSDKDQTDSGDWYYYVVQDSESGGLSKPLHPYYLKESGGDPMGNYQYAYSSSNNYVTSTNYAVDPSVILLSTITTTELDVQDMLDNTLAPVWEWFVEAGGMGPDYIQNFAGRRPVRFVDPPAADSDPGAFGDVATTNGYFYFYCPDLGEWRRVQGNTF
jgi:hypothetical protein